MQLFTSQQSVKQLQQSMQIILKRFGLNAASNSSIPLKESEHLQRRPSAPI